MCPWASHTEASNGELLWIYFNIPKHRCDKISRWFKLWLVRVLTQVKQPVCTRIQIVLKVRQSCHEDIRFNERNHIVWNILVHYTCRHKTLLVTLLTLRQNLAKSTYPKRLTVHEQVSMSKRCISYLETCLAACFQGRKCWIRNRRHPETWHLCSQTAGQIRMDRRSHLNRLQASPVVPDRTTKIKKNFSPQIRDNKFLRSTCDVKQPVVAMSQSQTTNLCRVSYHLLNCEHFRIS